MKLKALLLTLSILTGILSFASTPDVVLLQQDDGSKYGADSATCVMKLSLYREFYKQWRDSKYQNTAINDALKSWRWVFANCPRASENTYVDGARMIDFKIHKAKEQSVKNGLIDTLMKVYDQRIEFFPNHYVSGEQQVGKILGFKGVDYYKLDPNEHYIAAYEILGESIKLDKEESSGPVFVYYFRSVVKMAQKGDSDTAAVVDAYDMISDYVDMNIAKYQKAGKTKSVEQYENIKGNIENTFQPFANCEDLVRIYQKKFDETPDDVVLLKKISKLLDKKGCYESDLYFITTVALYETEPTPESAYLIGKMLLKDEKFAEAIPYLEEAVKMENEDLAFRAMIFLAEDYMTLGNYQKSRSVAYDAAKLNPSSGKPYIIIGDCYAASAKSCGDDELTKKVAYWAAVDKYQKARNIDSEVADAASKRISSYQQYFPQTELLFFHNLNEGDSYQVECWINETTTVRAAK